MSAIERTASGSWRGDLRGGRGSMDSQSGVLAAAPFNFATRFEHVGGTNPEELIAAAHAGCYSMALADHLVGQGYTADEIVTHATITLEGTRITRMRLVVRGRVPELDEASFQRLANEAERTCPVSNLLRGGLAISLEASLAEPEAKAD